MKRKLDEVVEDLSCFPFNANVDVITVWSDGKTVRQFKGQDKYYEKHSVGRTSPERGFRKMRAILIDIDEVFE